MSIDLDGWASHLGAERDAHAAALLHSWVNLVAEIDSQLVALTAWLPETEETRGAELSEDASAALNSIRLVAEGLNELEAAFRDRERGGQ